MKKLFMLMVLVCLGATSHSQTTKKIADGFYEVSRFGTDSTNFGKLNASEKVLAFNKNFKEDEPKDFNRVVIYTTEFVPLELEKSPEIDGKNGLKNKMHISLSPGAAAKLKSFTETRVMKEVAIVMDGEALTVHKVRVAITGHNFEITRCSGSACEKLLVMMKEKVKK